MNPDDPNAGQSKTCTKCGRTKDLETGFYRTKYSRDGYRPWCKDCILAQNTAWKADNPEKQRTYRATWRAANPNPEAVRAWKAANPEKNKAHGASRRARVREQVFDHYGNTCACCGETEDLTIDHLNGDGREHRDELGYNGGTEFYAWLIREGFQPGFAVLCMPCNCSKKNGWWCRLDHGVDEVAAS